MLQQRPMDWTHRQLHSLCMHITSSADRPCATQIYDVAKRECPNCAQVESNMLNYDLTPAKWASGNSTMRFSVETDLKNDPREIFEILTSMTWQSLRPLRRLRKLNRHRRGTVKKSR